MLELPRPKRRQAITKIHKKHHNAVILVQERQKALAEGGYAYPAEPAFQAGYLASVGNRGLRLLKLSHEVLDAAAAPDFCQQADRP